MKKLFSFAIVLAAAAMISCGGNTNAKAADDAAEEATVECCGECCENAEGKCCGEGECECCQEAAEGEAAAEAQAE